jgi:predicted acyltransferase
MGYPFAGHNRSNDSTVGPHMNSGTVTMNAHHRLASLDIFRGLTIAAMILVNNPGSWEVSYPQLRHAAWNGWTMTDMIFPFFLWIMGAAMTYSFARRQERGTSLTALVFHAGRRSLIIFALGIVVNGFPFGIGAPFDLATLRIPGVLQRIAICYLVVSLLVLFTKPKTLAAWALGFLTAYWLLMKLVPVPGYGAGVLDPVGNFCWYIDSSLLGGHTWLYAPAQGFDPEGIVSTLPAIATTIFGVQTGYWLRSDRSPQVKAVGMFLFGYAMLLIGLIADIWLPINKNLWTSSYAIFMGGWALISFSTIYWLADIKQWERFGTPFRVLGLNAITLYVASELLGTLLWVIPAAGPDGAMTTLHDAMYGRWFASFVAPANASFAFALVFVLIFYGLGWFMWKRDWIIRV